MLWVWGEPMIEEGRRNFAKALAETSLPLGRLVKPRRGHPYKKLHGKEAIAAYRQHLEKAAARTKKWREKKDSNAEE